MKKKVLFYYPSNKRSVQIETLLDVLIKENIDVYFLSQLAHGKLHDALTELGVKVHSLNIEKGNPLTYYVKQIISLIKFIKAKKIDVVFSNLQQANLISIFAQHFTSSKVICFRHHFKFFSDYSNKSHQVNRNEKIGDQLINKLARKIVVPSTGVYNGMLKHENVNKEKITIAPYMYRFEHYGKPVQEEVEKIMSSVKADLRLIMVSRLIPLKRHLVFLPVMKRLIKKGYKIHLFILDEGPEKINIERYISNNNLSEHITMLGFRRDFLNYMKASDLIIHPSITEASNSAVKEMALLGKTTIACKSVGDFDDYIEHGKNGFLCGIDNFTDESEEIIEEIINQKHDLDALGQQLHTSVLHKYSVNSQTINQYLDLLK